MRLKPLPDSEVTEDIQTIYSDISLQLQTSSIPLIFQYMANYPDYFSYAWTRIRDLILSQQFLHAEAQLIYLSDAMISVIYHASRDTKEFLSSQPDQERIKLAETIRDIVLLNAKLTLVSLAIRESIKGLPVGAKKLESGYDHMHTQHEKDAAFTQLVKNDVLHSNSTLSLQTANMLVPTFGSTLPAIIQYGDYFEIIAIEMEELMKTEAYLKARVELERLAQRLLTGFSTSLSFSYEETYTYLQDKIYVSDLYFLLKDLFPGQYPRLLITGSVMKRSISYFS